MSRYRCCRHSLGYLTLGCGHRRVCGCWAVLFQSQKASSSVSSVYFLCACKLACLRLRSLFVVSTAGSGQRATSADAPLSLPLPTHWRTHTHTQAPPPPLHPSPSKHSVATAGDCCDVFSAPSTAPILDCCANGDPLVALSGLTRCRFVYLGVFFTLKDPRNVSKSMPLAYR